LDDEESSAFGRKGFRNSAEEKIEAASLKTLWMKFNSI
jgi:hypothetical protein